MKMADRVSFIVGLVVRKVSRSIETVKRGARHKLVVLGTARAIIPAGSHRTVRISLNRKGKGLLETRHRLKVRLKIRELGHTFATRTVTFKRRT